MTPYSADQVSKILALVKFLGVTFSIRSGGHLQNPGFTSNDGGVVISLCRLKQITVSEDKTTAIIGAGLTWIEVYRELDTYCIAVTGGRIGEIGVSGLLLGGGLSFENSKYGMACNNVVEYEASFCSTSMLCTDNIQVVLSNCRIVTANAGENSDLFWALKGGCANFGTYLSSTDHESD